MAFSFLPTWILGSLPQVTPALLARRGIKLLMLDFDNTIVPYTTSVPSAEMDCWLREMLKSDVQICVVSNSKKDRVVRFCQTYGLDCITHARKPFSRGIDQCLERYHMAPSQCALVGDQIFTDTLGANCAGLTSILISAIDNHTIWLKLRHVAEMPFILAAHKRRIQS